MTRLMDIPPAPRWLGLAGMLPMAACLLLVAVGGPAWRYGALAMAWFYAALIFSFLGGLWWGLGAAAGPRAPDWLWGAAVLPSLIALATMVPWLVGWDWPGPALIALGAAIMLSWRIDRRLAAAGLAPDWWMPLRLTLSLGLGALTMATGVLA